MLYGSGALLLTGYERLRAARGETDVKALRALQRIIYLYEAWGKPGKAGEWRAKLPDEATSRPAA